MRSRAWIRHHTRIALLLAGGAAAVGLGCNAGSEPPGDDLLRARFPTHAAQVLEGERALVPTAEGFGRAPTTGLGRWSGLDAVLPATAEGAVRFEAPGGLVVKVRELEAEGDGKVVESAVAYRRAGGTSFWTVAGGGFEEWLHLEAGASRNSEPVAAWEVEGATLQQADDAVEVLDPAGIARIRVTAPAAYAESGRAIQARLGVRGSRIELWADGGGEAVLVDPAWTATGSLNSARADNYSARLLDGRVLVVKGAPGELFDPSTHTWKDVGVVAGFNFTFACRPTVMANGKVISPNGDSSHLVGLFDPATETWGYGASMHNMHDAGTPTALLQSGKVLVIGGLNSSGGTSEVYDPATNKWSSPVYMQQVWSGPSAVPLPNGKVLVTWGNWDGGPKSPELYDPATDSWSLTGPNENQSFGGATLLANGKVLVVRGSTWSVYDPATNTWTSPSTLAAREMLTLTLLKSGKVLRIGKDPSTGSGVGAADLFDPATSSWSNAAPMSTPRWSHSAALLADGTVLVAGGISATSTMLASTEIYSYGERGSPCTANTDCANGFGFCADGVCCDTACAAGPCDACSVAAGADVDGTCKLLTGPACDDGDGCTQTDTCQAGACVGGNPVVCQALDQCHDIGTCAPATGTCSNPNKANGTSCDDHDTCSKVDTCQAGVCTGGNPQPNGTACDDGNDCTQTDACQSGKCKGTNLKAEGASCTDGNDCTQTDTCQSGQCVGTNPQPDGASCEDGNGCTQGDTCHGGVCVAGSPVICSASDECHAAGTCDPATSACSDPAKPDGTSCTGGTCETGACTPTSSSSSSSSGSTSSSSSSSGTTSSSSSSSSGTASSSSSSSGTTSSSGSSSSGTGGSGGSGGAATTTSPTGTGGATTGTTGGSSYTTLDLSCAYRAANDTSGRLAGLGTLLLLAGARRRRSRQTRA